MMNEEMDQFEQRLRRQPEKPIPAGWRAEILGACREARVEKRRPERDWLSTFAARLSTVLWPHPKAWAGLAAVWISIFILHFSVRDTTPVAAEKSAPPSPELVVELRQQQKMLAELVGAPEVRVADRQPRFTPKPRSELTEIMAV